ncbi:hypothetical protein GGQ80_002062 [Sphingomonas jinjuensis]|uniref:Transposase n=1 Tax=Sphingomonas jinjuensis TaxID=535907 RepID=A0A840FBY0_9SPHN|nr:hypothetical protein [Sphingomonas jinjuensis]MBB4154152.1 hypothetical protein [Sphingomonas jinjuensis]
MRGLIARILAGQAPFAAADRQEPTPEQRQRALLDASIADGCAAQAERRKRKTASYRSHRFERARPKVDQLRAEMGR